MSVVLLASDCDSTWIVANYLRQSIPLAAIIIEQPVPRRDFLKRRIRRLGYATVAGQIGFQVCSRLLAMESRRRRSEIIARNGWGLERPIDIDCHQVQSANQASTRQVIGGYSPRVVVINGTRILSKRLLNSTTATFLNMHAGITPKYRGVHGGYWALAHNDPENAGVTVHVVDPGIDTGDVLAQDQIQVTRDDNFMTYPLLQLEKGLPLLEQAVRSALAGTLSFQSGVGPSQLFYHPTLWSYLTRRISSGTK